ncbi:tryptophan-rich sensory protein [Oscillatoria sp. FACHB-1407]|uniref:tryptophan-rich sensory protein n=1 Tax=Oscillatoria sp. FACHB-1407 TaxID=2692847 RepID=UPI0016829DEC|nr:tryptophan-rich sensory protein [Oscillatoria sp. FACHB-1407]MBD2464852.1 tryptophan-rich sensory protein [Oscillatoria sp. FACHB-1407]
MQPASSNSDRLRAILTLIAILGTLGVNVVSNIAPLNGLNIGEISNTIFADVKVTPANYAFVIWGLIYAGLIAFGVYQLRSENYRNIKLQRTSYLIIAACIAQIIWVFLFLGRQFVLSVVAMLGILIPLAMIYLHLRTRHERISRQEQWSVYIPMSVYFGWITVATVVNVATALYSLGWTGGGISAEVWTAIMIGVSAAIAAVIAFRYQDWAYVLVIVWALVAIAVRQLSIPLIAVTAIVLAIALLFIPPLKRLTDKS